MKTQAELKTVLRILHVSRAAGFVAAWAAVAVIFLWYAAPAVPEINIVSGWTKLTAFFAGCFVYYTSDFYLKRAKDRMDCGSEEVDSEYRYAYHETLLVTYSTIVGFIGAVLLLETLADYMIADMEHHSAGEPSGPFDFRSLGISAGLMAFSLILNYAAQASRRKKVLRLFGDDAELILEKWSNGTD